MGKIKMGMIGGGKGAFIGQVHRMAAALDGKIELISGVFSSDPTKSKASGKELGLDPSRVYSHYEEMLLTESKKSEDERIELVSIVTPNHMHFGPAKLALQLGFDVICDKPLCLTLEEAEELRTLVHKHNRIFALTHTYTGYPMVKEAKFMVKSGKLGQIRKVVVEYPQGWLTQNIESDGQKQAEWRTDPKRAGIAGAMGDIGTHAENLAKYITGLKLTKLCADLGHVVEGRLLDDDASILLRYHNGARGVLIASQISTGEENSLNIKVYGTLGSIEWHQMEPNTLIVKWLEKPMQILRTGHPSLSEFAQKATRLPSGHPEGYIEAFANIYKNVALHILSRRNHDITYDGTVEDYPTIDDGVMGMHFLYKVVASHQKDATWIDV